MSGMTPPEPPPAETPPAPTGNESYRLFDRALLARRRARSAAALPDSDFLLAEAAEGLAGRLAPVVRDFPLALDLGAHDGRLGRAALKTAKIGTLISGESCSKFLQALPDPRIACDEEILPIRDESLDLVLSGLSLQWVNDLPGALIQIRRALKPDGLFLAALAGGDTLNELRSALIEAESEITGGVSPRVAPFVEIRDAGGLLQRAGFALPVADADTLTVRYRNPFRLLQDLRNMGWSNALIDRSRRPMRRDVLFRAMEIYAEKFSDPDGRARATFEIVYLSGWAPHESQQQPLRPGSARMRLADALGTAENPAGEKAGGDTGRE